MSDSNKQSSLQDLQQINQLFTETLAQCSQPELVTLVQLLAGDLGELRVGQTQEQRRMEATQRQQLLERVRSGDEAALEQIKQQQSTGIGEVLSALQVIRQSVAGEEA